MSESPPEQPRHVETRGAAPEVGYRNRARAAWHSQSQERRWAIVIGAELLLAILLGLPDTSLGIGVALVAALFWLPKVTPIPWRLVAEAAILAIAGAIAGAGKAPWSLPFVLAIAFAAWWIPTRYRRWAIPLLVILAVVFYPFYLQRLFEMPLFGPFPDQSTAVVMLVFIMMAVGLNIVVGYAGLLDLGYVAFYAMGAYTAAWFASLQFAEHTWHFGAVGVSPTLAGFHVSIWLLLILAALLTAMTGVLIGLPTLRLRGDYLAIVTLGFGEILPQVARNGDNFFGTGFNLTNGPNGITPIDSPGWGNRISDATGGFLPSNYLQCCDRTLLGHQVSSADVFFWTALVLLGITVFCSLRLRDSRLGRAWVAIREDETAAAAMGVPLMRTKTWAYATGAFFGGIAGAYYGSFKSATFPGDFFFNISVFILCMVILGGMGNVWGVIVGAAFLSYLDREGLANTGSWINSNINIGGWHPNIDVPLYASGIYGAIILIVMLFRPEGLIPSRRRAMEFHEGVHDEPLYDSTGS
ncbi:MAG TPA: branched-chain amino acid ABC transporter permease [Gaiellaceae bacterium]|nr:branched-chain amino acid ABC transporter permease [Gaiellaceae bacterium]